jgi:hypothetical protein
MAPGKFPWLARSVAIPPQTTVEHFEYVSTASILLAVAEREGYIIIISERN